MNPVPRVPAACAPWVVLVGLLLTPFAGDSTAAPARQVTARHGAYHGWRAAQFLSNGQTEVIIVPEIGRVMQFRFVGDEDGPFWENRALDGRSPDARTNVWMNFGGDKAWPAPQADWPKLTPRTWPPPAAFDSMPAAGLDLVHTPDGVAAVLRTAVDTNYGIRTVRRISLAPSRPVLNIATTFEKVTGEPVKVAVWVVTQLSHPLGVYLPVSSESGAGKGYNVVSKSAPPSLKVGRGLLSLERDASTAYKIGNDAAALVWVGPKHALRIQTRRVPLAEYTHQGNSAELYTNPDALPYVELETLGPLTTLRVGDSLTQTNTYTLFRRSTATPEAEARKLLSR